MASAASRGPSVGGTARLLDLLRVVSRLERRSGFSSTLGIDHEYFRSLSRREELDWNESTRTLTAVVPMTDRLAFPSTAAGTAANAPQRTIGTLSTFQSLIDDLTTWSFVLADPKRGRAGVSVTLSTEWAPPSSSSSSSSSWGVPPRVSIGDQVVIESTVNKVGTNVGFATASVRTPDGNPVCFASHVKFLPLGVVTDFLSSSVGWPLARLYAEHWLSDGPPGSEAPALADLFEGVEFVSDNRATCPVTRHHASLGGPVHGGCQAVMMELVASRYLDRKGALWRQEPDGDGVSSSSGALYALHSMDLEYVTKPSSKEVEITVQEVLPHGRGGKDGGGKSDDNGYGGVGDALLLPLQVILESRGRVNSYGMLRYLRVPQ